MSVSKSSKDAQLSKSGSKLEGKIQIQLHYLWHLKHVLLGIQLNCTVLPRKTYVLLFAGTLRQGPRASPCESGRREQDPGLGHPYPMLNKPHSHSWKVPSFPAPALGGSHTLTLQLQLSELGLAGSPGRCTVPPPPHCLHTSSQLCQQDKPCYPRGSWGPPRPKGTRNAPNKLGSCTTEPPLGSFDSNSLKIKHHLQPSVPRWY